MEKIKLISFDVGGTIIDTKGKGFYSVISEVIKGDSKNLRDLYDEYFLTKDSEITIAVNTFCNETGLTTAEELLEKYKKQSSPLFSEVLSVLNQLKGKNYKLITFSNCTPWEGTNLAEYGLDIFFDENFKSFKIGYSKPNHKAFQYVAKKMNVDPSSILHIGDSFKADILGAINSGWNAVYLSRDANWNDKKNLFLKISNLKQLLNFL
jgi:putative hydrolase of the HAD superfamily